MVATGFAGATNLAIAPHDTIYVAELFSGQVSVVAHGAPVPVASLPAVTAVEYANGHLYAATAPAALSDEGPDGPPPTDPEPGSIVILATANTASDGRCGASRTARRHVCGLCALTCRTWRIVTPGNDRGPSRSLPASTASRCRCPTTASRPSTSMRSRTANRLSSVDSGWALGRVAGPARAVVCARSATTCATCATLITTCTATTTPRPSRCAGPSATSSRSARPSGPRSTRSTGPTGIPVSTRCARPARARLADELAPLVPEIDLSEWEFPDRWLPDGTDLPLQTRTLRVIATPGHTRGHVVFHDPEHDTLFAGDHILPHITPSIAVEIEPAAVRRWATTSRHWQLIRALPDTRLLPAHGPVTDSVHVRIEELLAHHDERLTRQRAGRRRRSEHGFEVAGVALDTPQDPLRRPRRDQPRPGRARDGGAPAGARRAGLAGRDRAGRGRALRPELSLGAAIQIDADNRREPVGDSVGRAPGWPPRPSPGPAARCPRAAAAPGRSRRAPPAAAATALGDIARASRRRRGRSTRAR